MSSLVRSTGTVGALTLVSRVLGFVRDMVIARLFGASTGADAFFVAFKIPNFMRRLFAEGAFAQAFVPIVAEYREQRPAEVPRLTGDVAGTLGLILAGICLIGVAAAPLLVALFAPGFMDEPEKFQLARDMLRLTFPYVLLIALAALAGAVLNTYGYFAVAAFTPVLLNVVLIAAAWWLAPLLEVPVMALAWGVLIAGLLQALYPLYHVRRLGLLARPRWAWRETGVARVVQLMTPALFGSSVAQINLLLDTLIASFLAAGSVSWLYYADRLVEFPLGVFGVAISTVILPILSAKHTNQSAEGLSATLDWALRLTLLVTAPATVALFLLAGPIMATLFQYGEFTAHDTRMSALALMAYSLGLGGFAMVKVLAPGFFARQDTRTPVRIGIAAVGIHIALSVILVLPMYWNQMSGTHAALALATSVAAFANGGLLLQRLRREQVYQPVPGWPRFASRVVLGCVIMAWVLWRGAGDLELWRDASGGARAGRLLLVSVGGAAVYFAALWMLGLRRAQWRALLQHR